MITQDEKKWIKRLQKVLNDCPSDRLGFYTVGDSDVTVYDRSKEEEICSIQDSRGGEFCSAVDECDAYLDRLDFPANVHSTAG